jgi:hypothetical protein
MRVRDLAFLLLTVLIAVSFISAQVDPADAAAEAAKKKKEKDERVVQVLDQLIADANGLKLPENRAFVLATVGDLYWKYDQKRARDLFHNTSAELVVYLADAEKEAGNSSTPDNLDLLDPLGLRAQVLPLIAKNDADLALEILLQTRPAKIAEAMQKMGQPIVVTKSTGEIVTFDPVNQKVSQEIALEQQFAMIAADTDPDKAIKMIKDSLAKGVSYNVIPLLQKLFRKDQKKANDLAGDVIVKLLDLDMARNPQDARTGLSFLQYGIRLANPSSTPKEKPFTFIDSQNKDVANKVFNSLMQMQGSANTSALINQAMPTLDKIIPEKTALLKGRLADVQKNLPASARNQLQQQSLWDQSMTPEQILSQIPKMDNPRDKSMAYQAISMKIGQITDDVRAKKLIDQIGDDRIRKSAQEQFELTRAARAIQAGNLDDARQQIAALTNKHAQIQQTVTLALAYFKTGKDTDVDTANMLMRQARAQTNDLPEDGEQLADLMEVARGYAVIEPETAFHMVETAIDQINDYTQATAVLSKFDKRYGEFKKGELIMRGGGGYGSLVYRYLPQMQTLSKADFEHSLLLADRFQRPDTRMIVRLSVLQGFLAEDRKPLNAGGTPGVGSGVGTGLGNVMRP